MWRCGDLCNFIETHIHLEPCFNDMLIWLNTWRYHNTRNQNFGRNDWTTETSHRISILFASLQSTSICMSTSIYVAVRNDQALAKVLCRKNSDQNPPAVFVPPFLKNLSEYRELESKIRKLVLAPLMTWLFSVGFVCSQRSDSHPCTALVLPGKYHSFDCSLWHKNEWGWWQLNEVDELLVFNL